MNGGQNGPLPVSIDLCSGQKAEQPHPQSRQGGTDGLELGKQRQQPNRKAS
jgi:hypothetical protein